MTLRELEQSGKYVFHGSGDPNITAFIPQQAYTEDKNGNRIPDDKPALHATGVLDIAIFMALINKFTCKKEFYSRFHWSDGALHLQATQGTLGQLVNVRGYIYVFDRDKFQQRNNLEWICYEEAQPVMKLEVAENELPPIETIIDPLGRA